VFATLSAVPGAVAQSGSAPRSHRGGQGFKSPQLHPETPGQTSSRLLIHSARTLGADPAEPVRLSLQALQPDNACQVEGTRRKLRIMRLDDWLHRRLRATPITLLRKKAPPLNQTPGQVNPARRERAAADWFIPIPRHAGPPCSVPILQTRSRVPGLDFSPANRHGETAMPARTGSSPWCLPHGPHGAQDAQS
jgi:hypothetical protein